MANESLKLLNEITETDDKERSEVVSNDTKPPTVNGQNLPAQLDQDIDVLLQETSRSNPILRWKKETNYRIGEDERELGREYIAYDLIFKVAFGSDAAAGRSLRRSKMKSGAGVTIDRLSQDGHSMF